LRSQCPRQRTRTFCPFLKYDTFTRVPTRKIFGQAVE
jgi:hypothetical protein